MLSILLVVRCLRRSLQQRRRAPGRGLSSLSTTPDGSRHVLYSRHTAPCLACCTCHSGCCAQAVASGVLDFSPADLPDANTWPTHGALRERLLLACRAVELPGCHAARDAFLAELVRLAPPQLARLVRRKSKLIRLARSIAIRRDSLYMNVHRPS